MFSLFSFPTVHELLMPTVQITVPITALEQCIRFGEQCHSHMQCLRWYECGIQKHARRYTVMFAVRAALFNKCHKPIVPGNDALRCRTSANCEFLRWLLLPSSSHMQVSALNTVHQVLRASLCHNSPLQSQFGTWCKAKWHWCRRQEQTTHTLADDTGLV